MSDLLDCVMYKEIGQGIVPYVNVSSRSAWKTEVDVILPTVQPSALAQTAAHE